MKAISDRRCPRCRADLALCETADHRYHECTSCSGVWLDRDTLNERVAELDLLTPSFTDDGTATFTDVLDRP